MFQSKNKYYPPFFFKHAHINTIYPSLYRKVKDPNYNRVTIPTPDNDFLDIDTKLQSSTKVVVLCHGLGGSTQSKYMMATANLLFENGYDVLSMNYRGCSGRMNNALEMYHAGKTDDIHTLLNSMTGHYDSIHLVGYSLGGNMVLKYISDGVYTLDTRVKSAIAISSPLDLAKSGIELAKIKNKIYNWNFVKELKEAAIEKSKQYPNQIDINTISQIKTLEQFDDKFTAPIHGFGNAANYYRINSAKQFLSNIDIPTMILQAEDDPFLSPDCFPFEEAKLNKNIHHITSKYGGHLGFYTSKSTYFWNEIMIYEFLKQYTND